MHTYVCLVVQYPSGNFIDLSVRQGNFAATFLRLTVLGYVLAVASVGVAVWIATQPILSKMQNEAKRSHLNTKAEVIARLLDDFIDEGRYVAEIEAAKKLICGRGGNTKRVRTSFNCRRVGNGKRVESCGCRV